MLSGALHWSPPCPSPRGRAVPAHSSAALTAQTQEPGLPGSAGHPAPTAGKRERAKHACNMQAPELFVYTPPPRSQGSFLFIRKTGRFSRAAGGPA